MQNFKWHELDNDELQEHEDLMSKEMEDITNVQIAYPPIVPPSVMALLSERHKELENAWFVVAQEMRDRKLPFLTPAED
jgi:hypothetical protein